MLKTSTFAVLAALIAVGAAVNGAATQRWSFIRPDPALTNRLHELDLRFADWKSQEIPTEMPTNERSIATTRQYASPTSGRTAMVTFISGIPGSVSTHTPDVCYPGSGYKTLYGPARETIEFGNGQSVSLYVADFEKKTPTKQDRCRVRWAWIADGTWAAPDHPRWQFATQLTKVPELYKVYLVTPLAEQQGDGRPEDDATTRAFLTAALEQYSAACAK